MAAEHRPQPISVEEYFEPEEQNPDICYEYFNGNVYVVSV